MRRIRKIAAILTAGAILVGMVTGCGKKADPKEIYNTAVEKNAALESVDMDADMKITVTQGEESLEVEVSSNTKVDQADKENLRYITTASTSLQGQSMETTMFYEGGYCYMEMAGQKLKYPIDVEGMVKSIEETTGTTTLPAESMKSLEVKEDGENQILTFTADPEKMDEYMNEVLGSVGETAGLSSLGMSIESASGEYTINKDGYYTDMKMTIEMTMEADGASASMSLEMTGKVNNPGQAVEITFPDTEGYTEVDPALLGIQ